MLGLREDSIQHALVLSAQGAAVNYFSDSSCSINATLLESLTLQMHLINVIHSLYCLFLYLYYQ